MLSCAELGFNESVDVIDGDFSWMGTIESDLEAEYSFTLTATDPSSGSTYAASGMGATDAMYTGMGFVMAGTWSAVPEPTSGLLLLLGVAGLALKRKRA